MLFATVTWVSATRRFERVAASSALGPSSAIHCSSQMSGVKLVWYDRTCWRKRATQVGVNGGWLSTKEASAAASACCDSSLASRSAVAARSADSTSCRRAATRRAIRLMFSTRPSRSIVGIAHSSPMRSAVTV